jgi:predicted DNA-binding protein YlxM (UPF0122 family)
MPYYSIQEEVEMLVDAGLLTERQAQAYVYRYVEQLPLEDAADQLGLATSTVSNYAGDAAEKIDAAEATLDALEEVDTIPKECADCGATLGGRYVTAGDGRPLCLECGDV